MTDTAAPFHRLDRRRFIGGAGLLALGGLLPNAAVAQETGGARTPTNGGFTFDSTIELARAGAAAAHAVRRLALSGPFADLSPSRYRAIRFRPDRRIWAGTGRGFSVELLPPGLVFDAPVRISIVADGTVTPVAFDPTVFEIDPENAGTAIAPDAELSYSGFSLRFPINRPDADDDILVFQGDRVPWSGVADGRWPRCPAGPV